VRSGPCKAGSRRKANYRSLTRGRAVEASKKMNGSRSNPSRHSDRTSLDALNRTIEGLEARIEGLMGRGEWEEA
ncbi:hypothetical protein, partial [Rhizobium leguminosarum]|uniref:hypothetical protein n=1 Tax=Rhizobium leguminosarum TaxID=384 RepID=UPI003F9456CF